MLDSFTVFIFGVVIIVLGGIMALGYLVDRGVKRLNTAPEKPLYWNGKFLVLPGPVLSANDGQEHYVCAHDLIKLYGVSPKDCIVVPPDESLSRYYRPGYVVLEPRFDGDYNIVRAFADANVIIGESKFEAYA